MRARTGGRHRRTTRLLIATAVAAATASTATSGALAEASAPPSSPPASAAPAVAPPPAAADGAAGFGSVGQAYALNADAGAGLELVDEAGTVVGSATATDLGSVLVRDVEPGKYTFRSADGAETAVFEVLAPDAHPDAAFYADQTLEPGLNYITTRDGVQLAATLRLPPGKTLDDGPFPTVIEYSGYETAAPGDLLGSFLTPDAIDPTLPLPAASTIIGSGIMPLLGFASVSLQMRGTGCSGGAFGLFDTLAALDGYDAIETIAAEPWVQHGRVGMVGISFSGISQFTVAGTQPPSLAAIAPLSPTDDLYSVGFPGGIFNTGFAASWLAERVEDAKPAHLGGQPWAQKMIELGDANCVANQALHGWAQTIDDVLQGSTDRIPAPFDERSPRVAAGNVDVPVFVAGAFQDEQTGGQWVELLSALEDNPDVWATVVNGTHIDSLGPGVASRWVEFLDLYVADELPSFNASVLELAGSLYPLIANAPAAAIPAPRFQDAASTDEARAAFAEDPRVLVLFDNGGDNAGDPVGPGGLDPNWELGFGAWPPPEVEATTMYFGDGGTLGADVGAAAETTYNPDPAARPATSLTEGDPWDALPAYDWAPVTGTAGVGFVSEPLAADMVLVGPGSVNLFVQSSAEDTDIQVTVSEVRADGQEMLVQTGQLRASHRAIDPDRTTDLFVAPTYTPDDAAPLPAGEFTEVRVPITAFGHAFRAGSQIRVTITAPGGERPSWTYGTLETGGAVTNTISLGGDQASSIVLPVVPGATAGAPAPSCPSNRGQPCRAYEPAANGG